MSRLTTMLLRSPLHRLRSGRWLLVDTGEGEVPVRYVLDGESVVVLGEGGASWWRDLAPEGTTTVGVVLAGQEREGEATFLAGEELDAAMLAYLHAHPSEWTRLGVDSTASGDDVATAAREAAVIRIDLSA